MNASEISSREDPRLNRIKMVSRLARFVVFAFFGFSIWFMLRLLMEKFGALINGHIVEPPGAARPMFPLTIVFWLVGQMVLCVWYWKLAQLFHLYEHGLIFSTKTTRCIKTLGCIFVLGWLLTTTLHFLPQPPEHRTVPPNAGLVKVERITYRMSFFSFDFGTGIDFGSLLAGTVVVLAAWIMDEGRKIQEEQELTV